MSIIDSIKSKLKLETFEGSPPDSDQAAPGLVGLLDDSDDTHVKMHEAQAAVGRVEGHDELEKIDDSDAPTVA